MRKRSVRFRPSEVPGARVILAGSGELERARAAAEAAGVSALVEIPGWLGFPDKLRCMAEASLFVLPSYTEGVPISLLEAMAAGLPSVVTPVGGVLDAVTDGQEALVVAPGDRAGLARAIVQILRTPGLGRALAATARQRAAAFDVVVYADHLERIYRSILDTSGTSSRGGAALAPAGVGGMHAKAAR